MATRLPELLEEKWRLFGWRILVTPERRVLFSCEHDIEPLQSTIHSRGRAFTAQVVEHKAGYGKQNPPTDPGCPGRFASRLAVASRLTVLEKFTRPQTPGGVNNKKRNQRPNQIESRPWSMRGSRNDNLTTSEQARIERERPRPQRGDCGSHDDHFKGP